MQMIYEDGTVRLEIEGRQTPQRDLLSLPGITASSSLAEVLDALIDADGADLANEIEQAADAFELREMRPIAKRVEAMRARVAKLRRPRP